MELIGTLAVGWMWLRIAIEAEAGALQDQAPARFTSKSYRSRYCAARTLPETAVLWRKVEAGAAPLMALPAEAFSQELGRG